MLAKNESEDDIADPTYKDLSTYIEKLDLREKVDMEVKANVSEPQKRQKKQYMMPSIKHCSKLGRSFS